MVPTAPATGYSLLLAKRGEDSLFVVNQSAGDFPLGSLVLGEDDGRVAGSEWGVPVLAPGECVTVWKDDKKPKAPDVTCTEVGSRLTREKKECFWKSTYGIYFNESWIANCDSDQCTVSISGETPDAAPEESAITAISVELLLVKRGEDSLFVVNQGETGVALSSLQVGEGEGAISGAEWGVDVLAPGQCVAAWKDGGNPKSPDVDCDLVGAHLTRGGKERFWKSSFEVFYGEQMQSMCSSDRCPITIPD